MIAHNGGSSRAYRRSADHAPQPTWAGETHQPEGGDCADMGAWGITTRYLVCTAVA